MPNININIFIGKKNMIITLLEYHLILSMGSYFIYFDIENQKFEIDNN